MKTIILAILFSSCTYIGMDKTKFERRNSDICTHPYPDTYIYRNKKQVTTFIFKNDTLRGIYTEKIK